jgi:hypothetical protein
MIVVLGLLIGKFDNEIHYLVYMNIQFSGETTAGLNSLKCLSNSLGSARCRVSWIESVYTGNIGPGPRGGK